MLPTDFGPLRQNACLSRQAKEGMETAGTFMTGDGARIAYRWMREGSPVSVLLHPNVKACVEAPGGEDRRLVFHVGGLAGAIERNVVRHFLAIETILETGEDGIALSSEQRLEHWHALTERHARQLRELDRAEYLDIKRREFAQSAELQKRLDAHEKAEP